MDETIFDALEHAWDHAAAHLHHHQPPDPYHQQQTPATTEAPVTLTDIANDIKDHIAQGTEWFAQITEQHVPAILAAAAKYEQSPIVQALEGVVLTPEVEAAIVATVKATAVATVKAAAALTPQPQPPAEQPTGANMAEQQPAQ